MLSLSLDLAAASSPGRPDPLAPWTRGSDTPREPMRALLLLLLGGLSFWAVLHFYPRADVGAAGDPGAGAQQPAAPANTVASDGPAAPADPAVVSGESVRSRASAPATPPVAPPEPLVAPSASPFADVAGGAGDPLVVTLGAMLAHAEHARVESWLAQVEGRGPRAFLAAAFAAARAGDFARAEALIGRIDDSTLHADELVLLAHAVGRPQVGLPRAPRAATPLARGMAMAIAEQTAGTALASGDLAAAARGYSDLLLGEIGAPWPPDRAALARWTAGLERAQAGHRWNPRSDWPAEEVRVEGGDTMTGIRKRFLARHPERTICTGLIERANRAGGRYLQAGEILRVPLDQASTLVDLDARWVLYLLGGEVAAAWEVAIGRPGQDTYVGRFLVGDKQEKPMWFPGPGEAPIPHGHPENPLGAYWVGWTYPDGRETSLGFHGTDEPETVGQAVSLGCVRMQDEDVLELAEIVPVGSEVVVQP